MISVEALELLLKVDSAVERHNGGFQGEASYLDAKERLHDFVATLEYHVSSLESQLAELQARQWISVADRLPEDDVVVLVVVTSAFSEYRYIQIAHHIPSVPQWNTEDGVYFHGSEYKRITHWMPKPEAPKEDEE